MSREIIRNSSQQELFRLGAEAISRELPLLPEGPIVWGLCGGRSPVGLFEALLPHLSSAPSALRERFRFLQVDERLFGEHNQTELDRLIFKPLQETGLFRPEQFLPFPLPASREATAIEDSRQRYEQLLLSLGGRFHVVILGIGEDGHVAGIFPDHESFSPRDTGSGKAVFTTYDDSPKPPNGRVTATYALLAKASFGVLLALGDGKRDAFRNFLDPLVDPRRCPAKVVGEIEKSLVLTDLV